MQLLDSLLGLYITYVVVVLELGTAIAGGLDVALVRSFVRDPRNEP